MFRAGAAPRLFSGRAVLSALRPLFDDLPRLLPFIERGYAMLTPNRRLARAIRSAYDEHQAANGSRAWATPVIMPLGQWLEECWSEEVMRGALEARQILDVPRQRRLWRQIIESDDRSFSLLGPAPAAQRCQQARAALKLWQVPLSDSAVAQEFSFSEDSAAFHR